MIIDNRLQVGIELEFHREDADGPDFDSHVHQLMMCVAKS